MRRLFTTIVLIIIALNVGAYVGKEKLNGFYLSAGKKIVSGAKEVTVWTTKQWQSEQGD